MNTIINPINYQHLQDIFGPRPNPTERRHTNDIKSPFNMARLRVCVKRWLRKEGFDLEKYRGKDIHNQAFDKYYELFIHHYNKKMLTIGELITELQKIEKDYGSQVKIIGKTEFGIGGEEGNKTVTHKGVNLYFSGDGNDKPVDTTYIELSFDEITIETKVSVSI